MREIGRMITGAEVGFVSGIAVLSICHTLLGGMMWLAVVAGMSLGTLRFYSYDRTALRFNKIILYLPVTLIFALYSSFLLGLILINTQSMAYVARRMDLIIPIAWSLGSIEYYIFIYILYRIR
jgi:hypothetical protein